MDSRVYRLTMPYALLLGITSQFVLASAHAADTATTPLTPTGPDCRCRAPDGSLKDLGTVQCVDITGNSHLMRCVMSTNTPYWKPVDGVEGCPLT